jgi:GT2 family glycosyltransferase
MIQEAIERRGWNAHAGLGNGSPFNYRVYFEPFEDPVSVKAVVPTRDRSDLLSVVLDGLWNRTDGVSLHTVIVDNGSKEPDTLELLEEAAARDDTSVVHLDDAFNFSRLCNLGVNAGPSSDLILLLNNDIEIEHRNWLLQLTGWLRDPGVVGAGPKLLLDDGTIQHAGVVVGLGGIAGHYSAYQSNQPRSGDLHDQAREVGCLTAACFLMRTDDFLKLGGLNETLDIDFQDVDLCLRMRRDLGGELVYDPTYPLKHVQSASRGARDVANGYTVARMWFLWGPELAGDDPYYSPHLSRWQHDLSLRDIPDGSAERSRRLRPRISRPR